MKMKNKQAERYNEISTITTAIRSASDQLQRYAVDLDDEIYDLYEVCALGGLEECQYQSLLEAVCLVYTKVLIARNTCNEIKNLDLRKEVK